MLRFRLNSRTSMAVMAPLSQMFLSARPPQPCSSLQRPLFGAALTVPARSFHTCWIQGTPSPTTRAVTLASPSSSPAWRAPRNFWSGTSMRAGSVSAAWKPLLQQVRFSTTNSEKEQQKATEEGEEQQQEEKTEKEGEEKTSVKKKGRKGKAPKKPKSFMDNVRELKQDYMKFPEIYNSANAINFIVFTVFCLCSTGSSAEEQWWLNQWGVDNTIRPWTWALHSFLTNNFLSMTYAMMLLHTMCHQVLPMLGSRGLILYCGGTAVISGAIMWLGNLLYYGLDGAATEKQFGPWDIVSALFVMEYLYYGITPFMILNSFSSWIKYACWVGEICILYFDWQPTFIGAAVGLVLCKGVPRFRNAKPPTGGKV